LDISCWGFQIEIYLRGLPHELFFIALTLWETMVIGPTKKLVVFYILGDLVF